MASAAAWEGPTAAELKAEGAEAIPGGVRVKGWVIQSHKGPILNAASLQRFEDGLQTTHLPEMVFGESFLSLEHAQTGIKLHFNALDALKAWKEEALPPVEVPAAAKWKFRSKPSDQVILDYDYTFTTPYCGSDAVVLNSGTTQTSLDGCGTLFWEDTNDRIDLVALSAKEPILFYDEVILYEDELADNGISFLTVRVRVMPTGWFLLLRFWLRVDGVLMRLRWTVNAARLRRFSCFLPCGVSPTLALSAEPSLLFPDLCRVERRPIRAWIHLSSCWNFHTSEMYRASNFIPDPNQELLDAKPLRSLAPMFPAPMGVNVNQSSTPPLVCVTPVGQFPTGFGAGNLPDFGSFATFSATANGVSYAGISANGPIDATPISAYKTRSSMSVDGDDEPYLGNQTFSSERKARRGRPPGSGADGSNGKFKRPKPTYKNFVAGKELAFLPSTSDQREIVESVHMTFEALRRRHLQMDETQDASRRADLKAGAIMMASNIRANSGKRVGTVPGVEIGDIFYFRMELCIIGLHAPSMGGIDYMTTKFGNDEDSVAICIVSAGGYENEDDDTDVLVYSGQGGNSRNTEERHDQKLERGNLALERSLHRKNEIRVVRGFKDPFCLTGKIYVYDGLYKIHESWKERTKSGINCFKYKLLREPGQRDGAAIWKMTQKWISNPATRGNVLLADLSSKAEMLPVCLVNEVDHDKGPGHFTYSNQVKYLRPLSSMKKLQGCGCQSVCLPGDPSCACGQHNGGDLPYSSSGLLACRKPIIYECGDSCNCSTNCRNRVTQKGARLHFEVFRTTNRGWGLRCWDPVRAGAFICEYAGEVIDELKVNLNDSEDDYIFQTVCPGDKTLKWNCGPELIGEDSTYVTADEFEPLPIKINAKNMGNVSRFMNHSCSPNVFWQPVQYNHGDDRHPHIMFFALKHIPPMTELTYDYGVAGAESSGSGSRRTKNCMCGSPNCRGLF